MIAVGTKSARPASTEFDGHRVLDADGLLGLSAIPESLAVVGAGVTMLEYASMAAILGVEVTVVERRERLLDFVDDELVEAFGYHLRGLGVDLRLGEDVEAANQGRARRPPAARRRGWSPRSPSAQRRAAEPPTRSTSRRRGSRLPPGDSSRSGRTSRTSVDHIFAAGEVIALTTVCEGRPTRGRFAALAAFGEHAGSSVRLLPYGIYTIPEISFVGSNERGSSASTCRTLSASPATAKWRAGRSQAIT